MGFVARDDRTFGGRDCRYGLGDIVIDKRAKTSMTVVKIGERQINCRDQNYNTKWFDDDAVCYPSEIDTIVNKDDFKKGDKIVVKLTGDVGEIIDFGNFEIKCHIPKAKKVFIWLYSDEIEKL